MMNQKNTLLFFLLLMSIPVFSQSVIKIPFSQNPLYVVEPREVYLPFSETQELILGENMEITGGSGIFTFSWMLGETILSTEPVITITQPGDYILTVNDGLSCEASALFHVGTTDIHSGEIPSLIQVYPNPVEQYFLLEFTIGEKPEQIELLSTGGQSILSIRNPELENNTINISTTGLMKGAFLVVTYFEQKKITKIIVKQ